MEFTSSQEIMLFYKQAELQQELPFIIRIPNGPVLEAAEINTLKTACSIILTVMLANQIENIREDI